MFVLLSVAVEGSAGFRALATMYTYPNCTQFIKVAFVIYLLSFVKISSDVSNVN